MTKHDRSGKRNGRRAGLLVGVCAASLLFAAMPTWADQGVAHSAAGTHLKVTGTIEKVQPEFLTVKTSWGHVRVFSPVKKDDLKVGEEVEMQVSENNVVIDIHRKGDPAERPHRHVLGKLAYASTDRKEIKLWTPEGEKTFEVQSGRSQLAGLAEGTMISVELNEAGKAIDMHRASGEHPLEIDIEDTEHVVAGAHLQLKGTVTKMQSGIVTITTPVGLYRLPTKQAPANAAVGDEVMLWLNSGGMVIDHHGTAKNLPGTHRMVTGKLIYAGLTKKEIKLWTPEGEKSFPLDRMEVKTHPIPEGTKVTVELDEKGTVIDLKRAD